MMGRAAGCRRRKRLIGERQMIELIDVTKRFGGKQILNHVHWRLPSPGVTVLTGASGAGKTTVARLLLGLDGDYEGEIRGVPEARSCVFQENRLLDQLTAAQNVRFVNPALSEATLRAAFDAMGMADELQTRAAELSGGMRRRVSILRALLSGAEFVVMDEPMKGLDAARSEAVVRYVRSAARDRTLMYITHSSAEIDWLGADAVWRLDNGRLTEWARG